MSNLAGMFLRMATSKPVESRPLVSQMVAVKYCECAGIQTPHIHRSDHLECAWCGNKVYVKATESSSQDIS